MAGYVFAIGKNNGDSIATIKNLARQGIYSTYIRGVSPTPFEGTLADYISMKPGDNVYFFCDRKFYGIGEIISIGPDCKYSNYIGSSQLYMPSYDDIKSELLVDFGPDSAHNRWICIFKSSPYFFEEGIDTDEILNYKPNTFKMLRAFWKVSFIKLGDEENNSLKEIFLLRHQREIELKTGIIETNPRLIHSSLAKKNLSKYIISISDTLADIVNGDKLKHEMALEAATVEALVNDRLPVLGHWDYVSHQVIASPFKPIDYMDKIDLFAARYLTGTKIQCKYLVAELKKDSADKSTVDQVLKYVDWVCHEYAYGDYGSVDACIIAYDYPADIFEYVERHAKRYYTLGSHPVRNKEWSSLRLLTYKYKGGVIEYYDETPKA